MHILIIEDEKAAATRLCNQIRAIRPSYQVAGCADSIETAVEWLSTEATPDLVFLDVQLSDGLCFKIFEQVKISVPVIFTTAFDAFALKAFELNSIDYLLKPINPGQLEQAIRKFESLKQPVNSKIIENQMLQLIATMRKEKEMYKSRFLVPQRDGYVPVLTKDIAYFMSEDNNLTITTFTGEKYIYHDSLDKLETELDPVVFWRANRSFIISAQAVKKAHNYFNYKIKLELIPGSQKDVLISRSKVTAFKNWFNNA